MERCVDCDVELVQRCVPDLHWWCWMCRKTRDGGGCGCFSLFDVQHSDHDPVKCLREQLDRARAKVEEIGRLYADARNNLRDRFAAAALPALLERMRGGEDTPDAYVAETSYYFADLMLAARERR